MKFTVKSHLYLITVYRELLEPVQIVTAEQCYEKVAILIEALKQKLLFLSARNVSKNSTDSQQSN